MEGRLRSGRKARRATALLSLVVAVAMVGGTAHAVVVGPGTLGGFEQDGNFTVDTAGNLDWANQSPTPVIDDLADSGFTEGSKEEDPANWVCGTGGANPPKGNILRAYANPRITATSAFLDLGFVREVGNGDAHLNFEFNRAGVVAPFVAGPCPIPRQTGDILVTYDFDGGDAPATIRLWRWDGTTWIELALAAGDAAAATNAVAIADDPLLAGTQAIVARGFGEFTVNLSAQGLPNLVGCPGLGFVNVRSRSSGESITSALQDKLPTTSLDLSTCGRVIIKKVDDLGNALPGATFGLFDNAAATGTPVKTCVSIADGSCTFAQVTPGNYWVKEISAPPGGLYSMDPDIVPVTVGFRQTVDLSSTPFVDPLILGSLQITKRHELSTQSVVEGVRFVLLQNGVAATRRDGSAAECTTAATGICTITNLVPGVYTVHEDPTTVPSTMTAAADQNVTIVGAQQASVTFTNPVKPLGITLSKLVNGVESIRVHQGDTLNYSFRVTNTGQVPLTINSLTDLANGAAVTLPTACLANVGTVLNPAGFFDCTYSSVAGAVDIANTATVNATDAFARPASADDTANVDVVHPAITLTKLVNGVESTTVHEGDTLNYSFRVTNSGDVDLTITSLTDVANGAGVALPASCLAKIGTTLAPTAFFDCTYSSSAGAADVSNIATVFANDGVPDGAGSSGTVSSSDTANVDVVHPAITLSKLVNGVESTTVHPGDALNYSFRVTNSGDVTLTITTLTDFANGVGVTLPTACLAKIGTTLAPAAFFDCTYSAMAGAGDVANVARVTATDPVGGPAGTVAAQDTALADVVSPAISLSKLVNGAESVTVHEGDALTYVLTITNTGTNDLTITGLDDAANGSAVTLPAGCTALIGTVLIPTGTASCSYSTLAGADDIHNVAGVTATDGLPGGNVGAGDVADVDVVHPAITITKRVNGAESVQVHAGELLTYTLDIRNSGDIALTLATLTDVANGQGVTLPAGCTSLLGTGLAVNETKSCSYTADAGAVDVSNTATVTGNDGLPGGTVSSNDTALVDVVDPAITITKLVNGAESVQVHAGDLLTYTLAITNTGDITLTLATLGDVANGATVALPAGCTSLVGTTVAPGQTVGCTYTAVAGAADVSNTATVTGTDGLPGGTVSSNDTALVDVVNPAITISKLVNGVESTTATQGETLTYTLAITNAGDVDLTLTALGDLANGLAVTLPAGCTALVGTSLAVGETVTCTYTTTAGAADVANVATVTGDDGLPGGSVSDDDSAFVDVAVDADLGIVKVDDVDPITLGAGNITYTLTVTNNGPSAATNVVVTDVLPSSVDFVSATPSQGTCLEADGLLTCTLGSMAVGSTVTVSVVVTPTAAGTITNTAGVDGDEPDGNPSNDSDTETTSVIAVLPAVIERPAPALAPAAPAPVAPATLPRTGTALARQLAFALAAAALGALVLGGEALTRRRWLLVRTDR